MIIGKHHISWFLVFITIDNHFCERITIQPDIYIFIFIHFIDQALIYTVYVKTWWRKGIYLAESWYVNNLNQCLGKLPLISTMHWYVLNSLDSMTHTYTPWKNLEQHRKNMIMIYIVSNSFAFPIFLGSSSVLSTQIMAEPPPLETWPSPLWDFELLCGKGIGQLPLWPQGSTQTSVGQKYNNKSPWFISLWGICQGSGFNSFL